MPPLLSVLMPGLSWREGIPKILREVGPSHQSGVEVISLIDNASMSIGKKMDLMMAMARGEYVSAVGDDDGIREDYIASLVSAIRKHRGVGCVTFLQEYWRDGHYMTILREGPGLPDCSEGEVWTRRLGPKSAIRREFIKNFKHPDISYGEDRAMSDHLERVVKTEHHIPVVLYNYRFDSKKADGKQMQETLGRT